MNLSETNIQAINRLCESYRVKSLFAFGSVLTDDYQQESDIDLVVDFNEKDPIKYSDLYFSLKENLENLLRRKIDLIEERGIKNPFFRKHLDQTKVKIYGH